MLVSVYIRKEDEDIWRKLPKKTEAIHKMLHNQKLDAVIIKENVPKNLADSLKPWAEKKQKEFESNIVINPERLSNGACKIHGTPLDSRGKCLQKGCRYA